jgi:cobalt-zinc-cadmium efflux system outer membrane protein
MHGDAVYSLTEAIQRRLDAIAALQPVIRAFPEDRLARMLAAAELADRQYRQGAIPLNLLIETQRATFEALRARSEALLMLWRETLELQSLS